MIPRQHFVNFKLDNVKMFVDRALSIEDDYVRIASGEEPIEIPLNEHDPFGQYESAVDILISYQDIVARAALNEINLIVEYELKMIATFIEHKRLGKKFHETWIKKRDIARKIIEKTFGIKLDSISGSSDVEIVRKAINAHKHDDGYLKKWEPDIWKHVMAQKKYKLDVEIISRYVDSAKDFLAEIPGERPDFGVDGTRRFKINNILGSKL